MASQDQRSRAAADAAPPAAIVATARELSEPSSRFAGAGGGLATGVYAAPGRGPRLPPPVDANPLSAPSAALLADDARGGRAAAVDDSGLLSSATPLLSRPAQAHAGNVNVEGAGRDVNDDVAGSGSTGGGNPSGSAAGSVFGGRYEGGAGSGRSSATVDAGPRDATALARGAGAVSGAAAAGVILDAAQSELRRVLASATATATGAGGAASGTARGAGTGATAGDPRVQVLISLRAIVDGTESHAAMAVDVSNAATGDGAGRVARPRKPVVCVGTGEVRS